MPVNGMGPIGTADPLADTRPKLQLEDGRLLPMTDTQKLRLDLYNSRSQTLQLQVREINRLAESNDADQKRLHDEVVEADKRHQEHQAVLEAARKMPLDIGGTEAAPGAAAANGAANDAEVTAGTDVPPPAAA